MRWERPRPVWPFMGSLACLFGLAVLTPYLWKRPVLNVHELMERRQTALPVAMQPLPVRTSFNFDCMRSMHAVLKQIVDARESLPAIPVKRRAPVVVVSSETDRLAMLDTRPLEGALPRLEQQPIEAQPIPIPQEALATLPTPLLRQPPLLLIERLERLATNPQATEWATSVLSRVRQLTESPATPPALGMHIVSELRQLATAGRIRSLEITTPAVQQNWLQAAHGLERRLGIWELLIERGYEPPITPTPEERTSLMPVLHDVAERLSQSANGDEWREYLLLDQLAAASSEGSAGDPNTRLGLGQEVMSRLNDPRLTLEQKSFVRQELQELADEMRIWAAGPVDLAKLLSIVERYEAEGLMPYATAIGQLVQRMQWSNDERLQSVAEGLQQEFRGPNMRVALSEEMFNRMVPKQASLNSNVRDRIAGTMVEGRSKTTTEVGIELIPTDDAWKFGLKAAGQVYSRTRSDTWPVRVRNAARYEYEAEKIITIGSRGLEVAPTHAQAYGRHQFLGADSQFDAVPFMGALFRNLAKREDKRVRPLATAQVKSKVVRKAETRMDSEADPKLHLLEKRFQNFVLMPFSQLALAAEPADMFTTSDRAVMQLRLANLDQLAAHTPRPSAPADSVVSMQLHDTAINNAFAGLGLEGRRMTLPELHEFLAEKFGHKNAPLPDDFPRRGRIEFATHDAVHVSFANDRLELVLGIRELGHGRDKIQNFHVHAYYRPQLDGLAVKLVRDDTLQFSGPNLKTGARIVLHSVMGKVFSRGRELPMVKKTLEADARFAGLMVTQLVIDDGWMALALGPTTADRTAWLTPNYVLDTELK